MKEIYSRQHHIYSFGIYIQLRNRTKKCVSFGVFFMYFYVKIRFLVCLAVLW